MRRQFGSKHPFHQLYLELFQQTGIPGKSSGRSQPFNSSSSNSLDMGILASFCTSMDQITHTQKTGHSLSQKFKDMETPSLHILNHKLVYRSTL